VEYLRAALPGTLRGEVPREGEGEEEEEGRTCISAYTPSEMAFLASKSRAFHAAHLRP